jgi:hypothetical protein
MHQTLYGVTVCDLRDQFPDAPDADASNYHSPEQIEGISQHHGGIVLVSDTLKGDLLYAKASYDYDLDEYGGIGYQLIASPAGRLFWTRNLDTWGCHTKGKNDRLLGIMAMGDWRYQTPPDPLLCALSLGYIILWRWCGGLRLVQGHNQWPGQSTECPGDQLVKAIPRILQMASINANRYPA